MNNALHGWRILVTRPAAQAETLCRMIRDQGGEAIELPAIEIRPPANPADIESRLSGIKSYDLGVFVSRNAVVWTVKLLGQNRELLGKIPLLAIGEGTADELTCAGFDNVEHVTGRSDSEALLQLPVLQEKSVRGKNVLVFRGEGGREVLAEALRKRGATVDYVEVYRRVAPVYSTAEIDRAFKPDAPDIVIVTSSEGLKNLLGMLSSEWRERLRKSQLVTIGDRLAGLAREEGFQKTAVVAEHATDEGLLAAILEVAGANKKMTEQKNTTEQAVDENRNENETDSSGREVTAESRNRTVIALFIILLIAFTLIAGGGGYYLWNRLQAVESEVAATSRAIEQVQSNRSQLTQLESEVGELQSRQQSLGDALSRLMQERPKDNQDWALAEVEYLLIIAMHRLLLEHDVTTALAALEAADRRLRDLHMPGVIPVREQIAADMNKLRAVETVDISGLAVYMADLIDRAAELPLRNAPDVAEQAGRSQEESGEGSSGWRNFFGNIWSELKSLVVIKHEGELTQALLLPDQEYFLYQNLRLELENARHAILRRDTANFHASIELVSEWLNTYFDSSSTAVTNILDSLQQMSSLELEVRLPDISSSLESLRAKIRQNEAGSGNDQQ